MSNTSLVGEMRRNIDAFRQNDLTAKQLAKLLREACHALESMPYQLIKDLDDLLLRLDQSGQDDEDGFHTQSATIVAELGSKLDNVPLDV